MTTVVGEKWQGRVGGVGGGGEGRGGRGAQEGGEWGDSEGGKKKRRVRWVTDVDSSVEQDAGRWSHCCCAVIRWALNPTADGCRLITATYLLSHACRSRRRLKGCCGFSLWPLIHQQPGAVPSLWPPPTLPLIAKTHLQCIYGMFPSADRKHSGPFQSTRPPPPLQTFTVTRAQTGLHCKNAMVLGQGIPRGDT